MLFIRLLSPFTCLRFISTVRFSPPNVHLGMVLRVCFVLQDTSLNTSAESVWYEHRCAGIKPALVALYSFRCGYRVIDIGRVVDI